MYSKPQFAAKTFGVEVADGRTIQDNRKDQLRPLDRPLG